MKKTVFVLLFTLLLATQSFSEEKGFTQEDRERPIRVETTLKVFMEQVDKTFEQLYTFLWIITGIFTTLTVSVIAFAYWDRRTIIRKAREETIEIS